MWEEGGERERLRLLRKSPYQKPRDHSSGRGRSVTSRWRQREPPKCGARDAGVQGPAPDCVIPTLAGLAWEHLAVGCPPGLELPQSGRLGRRDSLPCGVLSPTWGPGELTVKRQSGR